MIKKIILLVCCVSFIFIIHISGNTNPNNDIMIDELNQIEEVEDLLPVNETIVLPPIPVVSLPKYEFVNVSPIVVYSSKSFSWVWVDNVGALPNKSTYQKRLVNISKLESDIEQAPYQTREYRQDRFDCSNMVGVLVEHLDSRGWNADIVVVDSKKSLTGCIHTFIIVDRRVIVSVMSKKITYAEGRGNNTRDLDFFINTWDIMYLYFSREDAIRRGHWGNNEWEDWRGLGF